MPNAIQLTIDQVVKNAGSLDFIFDNTSNPRQEFLETFHGIIQTIKTHDGMDEGNKMYLINKVVAQSEILDYLLSVPVVPS